MEKGQVKGGVGADEPCWTPRVWTDDFSVKQKTGRQKRGDWVVREVRAGDGRWRERTSNDRSPSALRLARSASVSAPTRHRLPLATRAA